MLDQATIDSLRHNDVAPAGHLIDGVSDTGGAGEQIEVISPIDGTRLTTLADGAEAIVARAVAAARAASRWIRCSASMLRQRRQRSARRSRCFFSHSTHFSHMSEPILPISHL